MLSRRLLFTLVAAPLALAGPHAAKADATDSYPNHSIRMIVPYPPGGGADAIARLVAPKLGEVFGQTVIIDNRPGAGASIGTDLAAHSPPDGYTLLETPGAALTVNPQLMKVGYDPVKDLMPVVLLTRGVQIFTTNPKVPAKNMKEFIAYSKANPGKLNYGSAGNGTITQLTWEMLKLATGLNIAHVPYKGMGPAINDLLGGRVQGVTESNLLPYIRAGQMVALAVNGDHRWEELPDVPTLKEQGIDIDPSAWWGLFVPRGTPQPIIDKLHDTLSKIIFDPELKPKLTEVGMEPQGTAAAGFAKIIQDDIKANGETIKKAHITLD